LRRKEKKRKRKMRSVAPSKCFLLCVTFEEDG
jgi:hypothetical protein